MPTPLATFTAAAVVAAGGYGIGSALLGSGGNSHATAARVPPLSADPTGRPDHSRYAYQPPSAQTGVPALPPAGGQAPTGTAPNGGAPAYVPHGKVLAPLTPLPSRQPETPASTWKLYLSGGDLLQPDQGTAVQTNQSVGANLGGPCSSGLAGKWTAPATADFPFSGTVPGLLHVVASSTVTLSIALTQSTYGGGCTVLASTTASGSGSETVAFTLPRIERTIPKGTNLSLVVDSSGSARITSSYAAPSYIIVPTRPH